MKRMLEEEEDLPRKDGDNKRQKTRSNEESVADVLSPFFDTAKASESSYLDIDAKTINQLKTLVGAPGLATTIVNLMKSNNLPFPYGHFQLSEPVVKEMFSKLSLYNGKWNHEKYDINNTEQPPKPFALDFKGSDSNDYKPYLFIPSDEEYHSIDNITTAFTDESRMTSFRSVKGKETSSPVDGWKAYGKYVYNAVLAAVQNEKLGGIVNAFSLREGLYTSSKNEVSNNYTECAHERCTFLVMVFKELLYLTKGLPFRVFDSCAGWGDRLIVSMALNCQRYVGVDPNTASEPGFKRAASILGDSTKHQVLADGCPGVTLPGDCVDGSFSISFLSPPAYDSEFYSNDDKQSVNMFKNRDEWVINFLFPTINLCWKKLAVDGLLVIQSLLAAEINLYIYNFCPGSVYEGTLAMKTGKYRNKPLWVWKKNKENAKQASRLDRNELSKVFGKEVAQRVISMNSKSITVDKSSSYMSKSTRRRFMISGGAGLNHAPLRSILHGLGWEEVSIETGIDRVDFLCLETYKLSFDKRSYKVKCVLKSVIGEGKTSLTDKEQLFFNMMKYFPSIATNHMANTRTLKNVLHVKEGETLIVKPVSDNVGSGIDIFIVKNDAELEKARQVVKRHKSSIACTYIDNPLLLNGKKFHLRMYFLVSVGPLMPFYSELWGKGKILTAGQNYENKDYSNKLIHDTHNDSTPKDLWYPQDFPSPPGGSRISREDMLSSVMKQMKEITFCASEIAKKTMKPYSESDHAFEVFGVDFLVTSDLQVNLLEINERIGIKPCGIEKNGFDPIKGPWSSEYTKFSEEFFNWIYLSVIQPVFKENEIPPPIAPSTKVVSMDLVKNSTSNPRPSFIISGGTGLNHSPLRALLGSQGWEEVTLDDNKITKVDFLSLETYNMKFDKRSYKIRCYLKSVIGSGKDCIIDKEKLYFNVLKYFPDIAKENMAKTTSLKEITNIEKGEIVIVRPVGNGACAGRDISIVSNNAELEKARGKVRRYDSAIASTYIQNPMLWEGRKFHLRMYLMVCLGPSVPYHAELWKVGRIHVGGKPYQNHSFEDKAIHDTHVDSTPKNLYFPQHFPSSDPKVIASVTKQMNDIASSLSEIIKREAKPYEESDNAYEVFGVDYLITSDVKAILLEVNDKVGFNPCGDRRGFDQLKGPWSEEYTLFSKDYFEWVFNTAIKPIFDNKKKA